MRRGICYGILGLVMDVGVCLYYRAISSRLFLLAVLMSIAVTAVPYFVAERGITLKRPSLFVWYAVGAGIGTAIGMMIRL